MCIFKKLSTLRTIYYSLDILHLDLSLNDSSSVSHRLAWLDLPRDPSMVGSHLKLSTYPLADRLYLDVFFCFNPTYWPLLSKHFYLNSCSWHICQNIWYHTCRRIQDLHQAYARSFSEWHDWAFSRWENQLRSSGLSISNPKLQWVIYFNKICGHTIDH